MPVTNIHPEYTAAATRWKTTRDAASGNEAIKASTVDYLPDFVPSDSARYAKYIQRAYYMGATGRTRDALVGMAFRKPPAMQIPDAMFAIVENADGAGQSLDQVSREALFNLLETGRHVLFVDYPQVEEGLDAETEAALELRPTIASYTAETLINWQTTVVNGKTVLSLAVLQEQEAVPKDEFDHTAATVYRVLRLRADGYTQQTYNARGEAATEEYYPRQFGGAAFDHIPLHIVGANNNKPDVDSTPLYPLAVLNVSHYLNTADIEEASHVTGQPMLHLDIGDTSAETWKEQNPDGIYVGSRRGIVTQNGSMSMVQAEDRILPLTLMERKEEQMVAIGARLIQRGGQAETAEAARIAASAESASLDTIVGNLSEAIEAALEDCARFVGADPEQVFYAINRDFFDSKLDAQQVMAVIQLGDTRIISRSVQRHIIRTGRIEIPEGVDDGAIDAENEATGL